MPAHVLTGLLIALLLVPACAGNGGNDRADDANDDVSDSAGIDTDDADSETSPPVDVADVADDADTNPLGDPDTTEDFRTVEPRGAIRSWILLSGDPDDIARNLETAAAWGIEEVQLSHDIIDAIDGLLGDRALEIVDAIDAAAEHGLRVLAWSNEFDGSAFAVCFDPDDGFWEALREKYRRALEVAPALDGVVITMGSARPPPWLAPCTCTWCSEQAPELDPIDRALGVPAPADRVAQVVETVHDVVTRELGLYTYFRTFIHEPWEQEFMVESLSTIDPERYVVQMTKDVPNDWQPYYPLDSALGANPDRDFIMELDAAGEYWGQSLVPFAAVGYFERRIRAAQALGLDGYAVRIERGGNSALGTPNEVNLLAIQRLFDDPEASPASVYAEWIEARYGVTPEDPASAELAAIHEHTFDVGRLMYYQLGFWTLEKGSGIPGDCTEPELLAGRRNDEWDPAWGARFEALDEPDFQVVVDLRQQQGEAVELAEGNLARLDALIEGGLAGAEVDDLRRRLSKQLYMTRLWRELVDAMWSRRLWSITGADEHAARAHEAARRFAEVMDEFAIGHAGDLSPVSESSADRCGAELAAALPDVGDAATTTLELTPPEFELDGGELHVRARASQPGTWTVEWGTELPVYEHLIAVAGLPTDVVDVRIPTEALPPWIVVRVSAEAVGSGTVHGADYWVRTR